MSHPISIRKRPTPGRPSTFSEDIADRILCRLMEGESLRSICADPDMPGRTTVLRWQTENWSFGAKCARAREVQADAIFDEMQEIADAATPETVQVAKLRISTMQWRAAKLAPKRYGDKLDINAHHDLEHASTEELLAELAALLGLSPVEATRMVGLPASDA